MARPKKTVEAPTVTDEWNRGAYSVTKPDDKYVVRYSGNVVYATASKEDVEKYLDLVCGKA